MVVTTGSSGAFLLGFLAAFDPGDRVALAAPGYPAYRNILAALGITPVNLLTGAETRFQPTPALLDRVEGRIDGLIVASPSNPAGTMIDADSLRRLHDYCRARQIRLVSDEIYHGITYGMKPTTALALGDDAIVINSFSKYFSMTGWRLGWMVAPTDLLRPIECLAQNLFISPPTLPQIAASAAFDCGDELEANVRRYAENRALLLEQLPRAGFDRLAPADGAFYIYADVSRLTNDSDEFCRRMLAETGVAATPGLDFDAERGHQFMRFSFAGSAADIAAAADASPGVAEVGARRYSISRFHQPRLGGPDGGCSADLRRSGSGAATADAAPLPLLSAGHDRLDCGAAALRGRGSCVRLLRGIVPRSARAGRGEVVRSAHDARRVVVASSPRSAGSLGPSASCRYGGWSLSSCPDADWGDRRFSLPDGRHGRDTASSPGCVPAADRCRAAADGRRGGRDGGAALLSASWSPNFAARAAPRPLASPGAEVVDIAPRVHPRAVDAGPSP